MSRADQHPATVVRLGAGLYRASCVCGWIGAVQEGEWRAARALAEAEADQHAGREPKPAKVPNGNTPTRPVRISDALWSEVQAVASAQGVPASAVVRDALSEYLQKEEIA